MHRARGIAAPLASILAVLAAPLATSTTALASDFRLTLLHNNDGESQLLNLGGSLTGFGGVARFKTLVDTLRAEALLEGGVVMLSSGDNFLAGPEFNASLAAGVPFFDAIAMELVGYDGICIGNHEFDFGPEILADFVSSFTDGTPFLSCNLDVSPEPALAPLTQSGRIATRTTVVTQGVVVGIVGATTPDLPFISSPGAVIIDSKVKDAIQAEIDALLGEGVQHIVLVSHLQGIGAELALAAELANVDIMIAGGGSELLANPGDLLIPDDAIDANGNGVPDLLFGPYPLTVVDALGRTVPVVTTRGDYRYLGRLIVDFDAQGEIVAIDAASGPVRVAGAPAPDAVTPDPTVQALVTDPVQKAVNALIANVVAETEVPLDGVTASIRSKETNLGNLIADSFLWQATELAATFGAPTPHIALQNGGGIRNNSVIPIGDVTEFDTFSILPFANFLVVIPDVAPETLLDVLENAVSRVSPPPGFTSSGNGRFAQIAGFSFTYEVDVPPGSRVRDVVLDDGTMLVDQGRIVPGAPSINVATINFLATGGDQYDFGDPPFFNLEVSYQQALRNYLVGPVVESLVTAIDYPVGGDGRIVRIDNPADLDNNSTINGADLGILIAQWGGPGSADLDGDGVVDGNDLAILIANWS